MTSVAVYGCDNIPSAVLFSRDQAQHHTLHFDSTGGVGSSVVCTRSARTADAPVRASARDMAGECCCGGALLPGCIGRVPVNEYEAGA